MKLNLKSTIAAPASNKSCQKALNGIIGNTRRGIVVDKTLDPDSNNPVANKPVSTALAALAGQLAKGQVVFLDQLPESGEPHKVYVLTATNERYWWDGSAFVKIVPTDIKDSATIKHTLAENKISLDLDEAIKGKINAALQKPTGLTKTELVGVGASGQENIEIGDNLTLKDGKLAAVGGKSVSPTLNLVDFETSRVRTTITEEEYNNLKNGLYNSVNYFTEEPYETYLQSKLVSAYFDSDESLYCAFSSIKITGTPETGISTTNIIYQLNIGEKDTSGNYPITIEKEIEIPFCSGDANLPVLDLSAYNWNADTILTDAQITAIEDYGTKGIINIKLPKPFDTIPATLNKGFVVKKDDADYKNSFIEIYSTPVPYLLNDLLPIIALFDIRYTITDDKKLRMDYLALPTKEGAGDGFLAWDDKKNKMVWKQLSTILPTTIVKEAVNNKVSITAEEFDKLASGNYDLIVITHNNGLFDRYFCNNVGAATASDGKLNIIEAFCSKITHPGTRYVQSGISLSFSKNNLTSDINQSLGVRNESKLFNKNVRTYGSLDGENLLPCTTADNGKVLSVVNGEAQWAAAASGIKTLDIEFKFNGTITLTQEQLSLINSYDHKYVYVKFNEGIVGDNVCLGYVIKRQDIGTAISIVSQPNISGNIIVQSAIRIIGTTAGHEEITVPFSTTNSEKFLKTNSEGKPEWASISIPTITFED